MILNVNAMKETKGNKMSNELATVDNFVYSLENDFNAVNAFKLNFQRESLFALQLLKNNTYLMDTAGENQFSLQSAIINLAAIGISLNPASKLAYLVPRKKAICLDISAIGLLKLATDSGSVRWAQAEIVRKNDRFEYTGVSTLPIHEMEPFSNRGEIIGVYTVAKTNDGDFLVSVMSKQECHDIRDRSEAWKSYAQGKTKSCPWASDEGEMMKKTVIKRASKLWPKSERLDQAVDVINMHEGIDFKNETRGAFINEPSLGIEANDSAFTNIRGLLISNNKTEAGLIKYINGKFKIDLKTIEEMAPVHIEESLRALGGK
jgi:recombination protein RecT